MGAVVHWHACLCALALTTGSRASAATAEHAQPQRARSNEGEPAKERDTAPPIVITGSRIPRADLTAVSQVTTVQGDEFKLQGATNAEDVLNQLPQVNPSQGEFLSAGATGAATIDLRGLGANRTLVLRRR